MEEENHLFLFFGVAKLLQPLSVFLESTFRRDRSGGGWRCLRNVFFIGFFGQPRHFRERFAGSRDKRVLFAHGARPLLDRARRWWNAANHRHLVPYVSF
jgi:hypothetical protein